MNDLFKDEKPINSQPVLRHVLAHLYLAIDALADDEPLNAQDHIASIAGLIGMDTEEDKDWEDYYRKELEKCQAIRKKKEQNQSQ